MRRDLPVSYSTDGAFDLSARYALVMLGLIAGVRVRFVRECGVVHYGPAPTGDALWLPADPVAQRALLSRTRMHPTAHDDSAWGRNFLSLFPVDSPDAPLQSDIVAAAFFFFSRHEEWTAEEGDQFGRFREADSLLGMRGETDRPVTAEYGAVLAAGLRARGYDVPQEDRYEGRAAAAVMTHDIDYLSKFTPGLLFRETVKNALFNRRRVPLSDRLRRLGEYLRFFRRERDPYVYSILRMLEIEQQCGITASWLFKAGGRDKRDVSYRLSGARARMILDLLSGRGHDIGLHPSFNAHDDLPMLRGEAEKLRAALKHTPVRGSEQMPEWTPVSVRQHYLRFRYPVTWRNQVEAGFSVDSTLGFAEREGFRGGAAHPFLPFDLEAHRVLPIWEIPLTVMDGTLAHYRGLDPDASAVRIAQLLDITAAAGGTAVLLFHNTAFDRHDFPGWGRVFKQACESISDGRFYTGSLADTAQSWAASAGYASLKEVVEVINSEPA